MPNAVSAELLINTRSRAGRRAVPVIQDSLKRHGITVTHMHEIDNPETLPDILAHIRSRSPKILITASGDGTVSDVVDYLAGTSTNLGFIPLGTTNNFARSLGVPLQIDAAVQVISRGRARRIALGQVENDYFANVAGIGLSAEIAGAVTTERKRRFGRLAYVLTAIPLLLRHKPFLVSLADKDGELTIYFETHQIIVANGRFHAGREIAVGADLKRPELVVFKLGGSSRTSLVWHMLDFYLGRRRSIYHSSYFIGRDLRIATDAPQPIELDGEVRLATPVMARIHPKAVRVFVGESNVVY